MADDKPTNESNESTNDAPESDASSPPPPPAAVPAVQAGSLSTVRRGIPPSVMTAAVIWIVLGAFGLLGLVINLALGLPTPQPGLNLIISIVFLGMGISTVNGSSADPIGPAILSLVLGIAGVVLGVIAMAMVDPGTRTGAFVQTVGMIVVAVYCLPVLAGMLAMVGRQGYKAWHATRSQTFAQPVGHDGSLPADPAVAGVMSTASNEPPVVLTPPVLREERLAQRHLLHAGVGMFVVLLGLSVLALAGSTDPSIIATVLVLVLIGLFEFLYGVHSYLSMGRIEPLANVYTVMKRELRAYFSSPIAVTVFVIFHLVAIVITLQGFGMGGEGMGLWERGFADMEVFFRALPWLLLFVVPALSMRLWAEERQTGSIELLMTLPMSRSQVLLGKFFGAWLIVAWMLFLPAISLLALLLRVGSPDVGQIAASFIGAVLMGGAYLALGSFLSSLTRDQIVAFILTVVIAGAISLMGSDDALDAISAIGDDTQTVVAQEQAVFAGADSPGALLAQTAQRISLASRFRSIGRGVIDISDVLYYVIFIGFFLYLNAIVLAFRER